MISLGSDIPLPRDRLDDFAAKCLQRVDCIVSGQMHANHAPALRLERLEIAEVLRLVELRKIVRSARNSNRLAMFLGDLQEQSDVRTALVQLSGRMQASRAVAEGRCDAVAFDDRLANRRDLLVDGGIWR